MIEKALVVLVCLMIYGATFYTLSMTDPANTYEWWSDHDSRINH